MAELSAGSKRSHWMWFVFPQVAGLGSQLDGAGVRDLRARRGPRLPGPPGARPAAASSAPGILVEGDETDEERIFGPVDAIKLRSSMTLFAHAAPAELAFRAVLGRFYAGVEDDATLARLR